MRTLTQIKPNMNHLSELAGLRGQAGLGAVEGLDLALFVDGDDNRMGGRVHVEADDILDLIRALDFFPARFSTVFVEK
jgi:hypothetical protein